MNMQIAIIYFLYQTVWFLLFLFKFWGRGFSFFQHVSNNSSVQICNENKRKKNNYELFGFNIFQFIDKGRKM